MTLAASEGIWHFKWSARDQTFTVLPPSEAVQESKVNIALTARHALSAPYGKPIDFSLDRGAQNTVLHLIFGDNFLTAKAAGLPENHQVIGVGGSANTDSVSIPSLTLTVGGRPCTQPKLHEAATVRRVAASVPITRLHARTRRKEEVAKAGGINANYCPNRSQCPSVS